jgi:hypothetical protein
VADLPHDAIASDVEFEGQRRVGRDGAGPFDPSSRQNYRDRLCDTDRRHEAIRPLLDVWALKSSTLERNSLRIGDLFALL